MQGSAVGERDHAGGRPAQAAAYLAIAHSDGKAGVVIFTDSAFTIALAKSNTMAKLIKQCKSCQLLEIRIQSLGSATRNMHQVTASLLQKYGTRWTYSLAINDLYFDGMVPALTATGIKPGEQLFKIPRRRKHFGLPTY